jgi:hypothetical protein
MHEINDSMKPISAKKKSIEILLADMSLNQTEIEENIWDKYTYRTLPPPPPCIDLIDQG